MPKGLDVGTSFLITADETTTGIEYKEFRDAFYRMKPATKIAAKMMERGLQNVTYLKDIDGSYVVVGADAIAKAIEKKVDNVEFLFVGAEDRMEMEKIPTAGYKIEGLWISGLQRSLSRRNLLFPFKVLNSILKDKKIIRFYYIVPEESDVKKLALILYFMGLKMLIN